MAESDEHAPTTTEPNKDEFCKRAMSKFKEVFVDEKGGSAKLYEKVCDFLEQVDNPYVAGLDLAEKAGDYLQPRSNSLSSTLFRMFKDWYFRSWRNQEAKNSLLSLEIQKRAFDVCSRRHTHLLWMAADVYRLREINESFINDIRMKCENQHFNEAVACATVLKLQLYFGLNEIIIPCVLQDKVNYIEPYLDGFPTLQRELLEILDPLCASDANVVDFISRHNVTGVRKHKLCVKPLLKLIARYAKLYNIPSESTPNLTKSRSQGTLRYLLHRRYNEKAMDAANFDDMVHQAVETCPHLAPYLLQCLCDFHNDLLEACKWAKSLNVPQNQWPYRLAQYVAQFPHVWNFNYSEVTENAIESDEYLKLPFIDEDISMVGDELGLEAALKCIEEAEVVGLDTETQPIFGHTIAQVALLQISTREKAFLLDLTNLPKNVGEEKLKMFMTGLFCNEKILKIGFQFAGDVKTLLVTLPYCKESFYEMRRTLCIGSLIDHLKHENLNFMSCEALENNEMPDVEKKEKEDPANIQIAKPHCGLSGICKYFLGKPLKKGEQFSNWNRRPLRKEQIRYAALDAFCLIELFDKVKERAAKLSVDFDKAFESGLVSGSKMESKTRTKKSTSVKNMERAELLQLIEKLNERIKQRNADVVKRPKDLSVIVDNMLHGLGKHLRRCGVDCIYLENYEIRENAIDLARKEMRLVLSSGSAFTAISSRLPPDLVCSVPNMLDSKEQLIWFLDKFNVVVSEEDVFSRCMVVWDSLLSPADYLQPVPFNPVEAVRSVKTFVDEVCSNDETAATFYEESLILKMENCTFDLAKGLLCEGSNLKNEVKVQIDNLPGVKVFETIPWFYICRKCGKIYWYGAHMNRYIKKIGIVVKNEERSLEALDEVTINVS